MFSSRAGWHHLVSFPKGWILVHPLRKEAAVKRLSFGFGELNSCYCGWNSDTSGSLHSLRNLPKKENGQSEKTLCCSMPRLTSSRTHHQYLMDHPLHGAQFLLPQGCAVGTPQRCNASLPITFEVCPFLHDLTHLSGNKTFEECWVTYCIHHTACNCCKFLNYCRQSAGRLWSTNDKKNKSIASWSEDFQLMWLLSLVWV